MQGSLEAHVNGMDHLMCRGFVVRDTFVRMTHQIIQYDKEMLEGIYLTLLYGQNERKALYSCRHFL